jgi:hypothetical protein
VLIKYGNTANFVVSYDSSFTGGGQPNGPALAQGVLDFCEYDLTRLSMLFGGILPPPATLPVQINLVPGAGGGNNNGSNVININCNLNSDPLGLPAIVVAELGEILMTVQNKGWIESWSNGEALSRDLAQILYPNRAWLFSTGNAWLNGGRPDWVDNVEHTDQDSLSYACGSLFLNYLAYQLNKRWSDIIQAGAPTSNTLAETATALGVVSPWTNFVNLINTYLPFPMTLPAEPIGFGQLAEPIDDAYPLGPLPEQVPLLYTRHNLADDGTSHTGSLSDSPDIILKNDPVANPQVIFSTLASIASDTESDPDVITGQANYVYLRVWNRGLDAANVFATVYWSPPATLVTPNMWNLIGSAYYPDVPPGSLVKVSNPGIPWPGDQIPRPGHYCFVTTVGSSYAPAPNSGSFASFDDFVNFVYTHNNITWRNFNVVLGLQQKWGRFGAFRFLVTGAWDAPHEFVLEAQADLPDGSHLALQVPQWIGHGLRPSLHNLEEFEDEETDPHLRRRLRIPVPHNGRCTLGSIGLPNGTAAPSHLLIDIPNDRRQKPHRVVIRQLYENREVGRITWLLMPMPERD